MNRYFKVAETMKQKGKVPFVHAQKAAWRAPRIFLETPSSSKGENTFFRFLRQPSSRYMIDRETLLTSIESHLKKHGKTAWTPGDWNFNCSRLDDAPELHKHLVSVSYSMMDFAKWESATHFFFSNSNVGSSFVDVVAEGVIAKSMKIRGKTDEKPKVLERLKPLYEEYEKLDRGTLYVIGIPREKWKEFVYDSKTFGIPTGEDVLKIADNLGNATRAHTTEEGGLQARIMIHKDTLNPSSGIAVVDVTDPDETEKFCHEIQFEKSEEIDQIFREKQTDHERKNLEKQMELDTEVRRIAREYA